MKQNLCAAAAILFSATAWAEGRIVITEIMYDPDSQERRGETEWVEIANVGDEPAELTNWSLDDEDTSNWAQWGRFSCTLQPGEVAVLVNANAVTEAAFREAWDDAPREPDSPGSERSDDSGDAARAAPAYQVIPIKWGSLSNDPTLENEILRLIDGEGGTVCEVNLAEGVGGWPEDAAGGPSIYLTQPAAKEPGAASLWKRSRHGVDHARRNRATTVFDGEDVGSPGRLPDFDSAVDHPEKPGADDNTIDY